MTRVVRFTATERALHWAFAATFLTLLTTGLPLMFPLLRGVIRGYSPAVGLRLHLAAAVLWIVAILAVVVLGDRRRLARTGRELLTLRRADWFWIAAFPRWLVASPAGRFELDRAVGRFNGGQKVNAMCVVAASILLLVTGVVVWPGADLAAFFGQRPELGAWITAHRWLAIGVMLPIGGHVFLAAIHRATRGALRGMVDGRVDAEWAARHHPVWRPDADDAGGRAA